MTSELAAGMDVCAAINDPVVLAPGDIRLVPCGFAVAIPEGYEMQVRPRSGLAVKHGVTVINAPGTIDADYRGEVKVGLVNLGRVSFTIRRGDRIAQMILAPVARAALQVVSSSRADDSGQRRIRSYRSAHGREPCLWSGQFVRFSVLGSGSKGNCTLVESGSTRLLIDNGFSGKEIVDRLQQVGYRTGNPHRDHRHP